MVCADLRQNCIGELRLKAETKIVIMETEHGRQKVNLVVAWIWAVRGECKIRLLGNYFDGWWCHLLMRNGSGEREC